MTDQNPSVDSNKNVLDFLEYYCDPNNPFDFAVMLKGPWGAGKTYLIKSFIEKQASIHPARKTLYVSLYGISSYQQIEDEFFRQLHPILGSKGAKIAATVGKGLLKTALRIDLGDKEHVSVSSQLPDVNICDYLVSPKDCLLVFDDLERCSIQVPEVLGYINSFVEHEGLKVIIVGNEDEILNRGKEDEAKPGKDDRYAEIKEKLIGRTFAVRAEAVTAVKGFLELIHDARAKQFLQSNMSEIVALHKQSETNNLRILKQSLWDFERVAACFSANHWKKAESLRTIMRVVLTLSFEMRAGRLEPDKMPELQISKVVRFMKAEHGKEQTIIDSLEKRYSETDFDQRLVSAGVLKALLFDGWVDPNLIRKELDASPPFALPESIGAPLEKSLQLVEDY